MEDRNSTLPVTRLASPGHEEPAGDECITRPAVSRSPQRGSLRHCRRTLDRGAQAQASEPHWWAR